MSSVSIARHAEDRWEAFCARCGWEATAPSRAAATALVKSACADGECVSTHEPRAVSMDELSVRRRARRDR